MLASVFSTRGARVAFAGLLAIATAAMLSCNKNPRDTSRQQQGHQSAQDTRRLTPLSRMTLDNGITVYLQEEHTDKMVAVEVFYRGGLFRDPPGEPQLAHLTEHAVEHAPCGKFKRNEVVERVRKTGLIASGIIGGCVHYDYFVPFDHLDESLAIEAARLTSARFDAALLADNAKQAAAELDGGRFGNPRSIKTPAFVVLKQALYAGAGNVPVRQAIFDRTPEEVRTFHNTYYRPDNMVIVIIGGFDHAATVQMVREHFGNIPRRPDPPRIAAMPGGNMRVSWDIDAKLVFYVYGGPYTSFSDRLALTMFGTYLRRKISDDQTMRNVASSSYTSNPVYPVGRIPFFVFGQPVAGKSLHTIRTALDRIMKKSPSEIDARTFGEIRENAKRFVESSMIKQANPYVPRQQFLGQEALNVGLKHYFMEGMTRDDFFAALDAMTFDEFQAALARTVTPKNRRVIEVRPR